MSDDRTMSGGDARDFQLMALAPMTLYGLVGLKFDLNPFWLLAILATALATQLAATRILKLPKFEWKSAMISGLSLCLLMRCDSLPLSLFLAFAAIASKFTLRYRGKHIFNPTNFALVLGILATGLVRVDPGQWGRAPWLLFLILCMGVFVVSKACRRDVSVAFIATYVAALFAHAAANGIPFGEPLTRIQSGSLLIFTFFMISDPKTTPDSRNARLAFGAVAAIAGAYLQLYHANPAGLLIALAFLSVLTPVADRLLPGTRYRWGATA